VKYIKELTNIIIPHFDKYPLITQKRVDFELFKLCIDLLNKKEHSTIEGLTKVVAIKASMHNGLTDDLKKVFSSVIPVDKPLIQSSVNLDPY
jgi:hypothetical protein